MAVLPAERTRPPWGPSQPNRFGTGHLGDDRTPDGPPKGRIHSVGMSIPPNHVFLPPQRPRFDQDARCMLLVALLGAALYALAIVVVLGDLL